MEAPLEAPLDLVRRCSEIDDEALEEYRARYRFFRLGGALGALGGGGGSASGSELFTVRRSSTRVLGKLLDAASVAFSTRGRSSTDRALFSSSADFHDSTTARLPLST